MTLFKRLRDTFLVVLLLAVPFFFLRASIRKPEELNAVDRAILRIAAPLQYAAAAARARVSNVVGALRLSGRREGGQRPARLRKRAPAGDAARARASRRPRTAGSGACSACATRSSTRP